jgi:PHD/YefM family antitoxin component YafN of YafNO toxin-antitoxin module
MSLRNRVEKVPVRRVRSPWRSAPGVRRGRFRRRWSEETAYILSSPANARRLLQAMKDAEEGRGIWISSVDELRRLVGL